MEDVSNFFWLQVEYVIMEKQQDNAYREAIEEYRAASRARIAKLSKANLSNIVGVLPQRQISNYFVQFRKVLQIYYCSLNKHLCFSCYIPCACFDLFS